MSSERNRLTVKARLRSRIYIVGAGYAGTAIANEIKAKGIFGRVVAFLDDDPDKIGRKIQGVPIVGPIADVAGMLKATPDDEAIIAIPSGTRGELLRIRNLLRQADFSRIRVLPAMSQVLDGDAHLVLTRDFNPEDLLSRDPVKVSLKESLPYVRGKRVLITGAGGSIGSELARQLLHGGAQRLYLFGHGENSIFGIDRELRLLQKEGVGEAATIVPIIGELQDGDYVRHIMSRLRADIVFHTAAHKHVTLMEENPVAAVQNNVFGTRNLIEASIGSGVQSFVMISTDKAVDPICVYGASKRIAEELVLREREAGRRFLVVRFGNVLASRGSIVHLFLDQIRTGGPVTVTDPEVTRFFMTIPEASSLVLKAAGVDVDADMLLLDMGEPVGIRKLAEDMITFQGYEPGVDIPIVYTGLRPGEKLHERLWSAGETPSPTPYPGILAVNRRDRALAIPLQELLEALRPVCFLDAARAPDYRNRRVLRGILHRALPSLEASPDEPEY
jgi:FlaA1/EpsC-like NDP-sugar epimerase